MNYQHDRGTQETLRSIEDLRSEKPPLRIHITSTGAGASLQSLMWSVCGCSKFLVGAEFPYSQDATQDMLGFDPVKFAAANTAIDLAISSFLRAIPHPDDALARPVGIGIAASVASSEIHRGDHRVHIAVVSDAGSRLVSAILGKGVGAEHRARDGRAVDLLALQALFDVVGGKLGKSDEQFLDEPSVVASVVKEADAGNLVMERLLANPLIGPDCKRAPASRLNPRRTLLHPCTANPPHPGHVLGALAALDAHHGRTAVTARVVHALTLDPPNKPRVTATEALRRARALGRLGRDSLVSMGDPLFVDKAERFPGSPIVLGADSAISMLDPRWGVPVADVLTRFEKAGTRLYIVGRLVGDDFVTLAHPRLRTLIPLAFQFMFHHVPGRWDVSSTLIRNESVSSA